jgi:2-polyprenyl-3-methyl-5-hydroxy-6-metoxy-1,4-benzoquinol methylase
MNKKGWFEDWFDTEFYHLLYKNRDDKEAALFIKRIVESLSLSKNAKVADIACGKGRHSRVLAGLGYAVHGYDLSENSIDFARKHASGNDQFYVHDMRVPYAENGFEAVFNLFTSFGYFESKAEDMQSLANICQMLSPGGFFIQDYINGAPVLKTLPTSSEEMNGGYLFKTQKVWQPPFVVKSIDVTAAGKTQSFQEKVKVFTLEELVDMHQQCGFVKNRIFGDYQLGPFDPEHSPRMVVISKKEK